MGLQTAKGSLSYLNWGQEAILGTSPVTGSVLGVNVTAGGSGYTSSTVVSFSGGGGSGAAGNAVIVGGAIVGVKMTAGGTGYTSAPAPAFSIGSGAAGTTLLQRGFFGVPFVNEGFDSSINPITSQEIRPDRTVPGVRGGNRAAGGPVTTDFGIRRYMGWFQHLLGGSSLAPVYTKTTVTPAAFTGTSLTWVRGDYVLGNGAGAAGSAVYLCIVGGTEPTAAALTHTSGEFQAAGGSKWQYVGRLGRSVADAVLNSTTLLTSATAAFTAQDVGSVVSGIGIPNGTTIAAFTSATNVDMSAAATATGSGVVLNVNQIFRYVLTAGAILPSGGISVEKGIVGGDTNLYQVWNGGRINSLRMTVPQEGMLQAAWDFVFLKTATATSAPYATGAVVADSPVVGYEAMLTIAGSENYDLRDGNFEIMNNISSTDYRIGSRDRKAVTEARREIKGQFTAYFTDATLFTKFQNEDTFATIFSFYRKGEYMSLEFPECKFFGTPIPKIGGPGVVSSSFDIVAFKEAAGYDCQLVIKTYMDLTPLQTAYGIL